MGLCNTDGSDVFAGRGFIRPATTRTARQLWLRHKARTMGCNLHWLCLKAHIFFKYDLLYWLRQLCRRVRRLFA